MRRISFSFSVFMNLVLSDFLALISKKARLNCPKSMLNVVSKNVATSFSSDVPLLKTPSVWSA